MVAPLLLAAIPALMSAASSAMSSGSQSGGGGGMAMGPGSSFQPNQSFQVAGSGGNQPGMVNELQRKRKMMDYLNGMGVGQGQPPQMGGMQG